MDKQDAVPAASCDRCGCELYGADGCYYLEGQTVCMDCLKTYAERYFKPWFLLAGDLRGLTV